MKPGEGEKCHLSSVAANVFAPVSVLIHLKSAPLMHLRGRQAGRNCSSSSYSNMSTFMNKYDAYVSNCVCRR